MGPLNRRQLLAGVAVATLMPSSAEALFPHGADIPHGWNTLPLGAGGLVTGFDIAPDGTMVCRTDVGNIYRWSGTIADATDPTKKWVPLITYASVGAGSKSVKTSDFVGGYEFVIAPTKTTNYYAIFPQMNFTYKFWVWYSTNSGATWTQSNLSMNNATSAGTYRLVQRKMAVDPNNENVVYCGMPVSSGNSFAVYRAIDGVTFNPITSTGIGVATTVGAGCCGICFDPSQGTVTVSGQTRTARIIIPVGGVGIFESLDGGQTFTEVAVTAFGTSSFYIYSAEINNNGVYYAAVTNPNKIWRYSGPSGTWTDISPQAGWGGDSGTMMTIDPRAGHEGYLLVTFYGVNAGFNSSNADTGNPPTWTGALGGETATVQSASYDLPWYNDAYDPTKINQNPYGSRIKIDTNGRCWWSGGGFFYFNSIPNYASLNSISNSMGRGTEIMVAEDIICPPGATYPVMAPQEIGRPVGGTFTKYPIDEYPRYLAGSCESLDYAASDPAFIVGRQTQDFGFGDYSSYSTNYGASWTPFFSSPTAANTTVAKWQCSFTGNISGTTLNVTGSVSGIVQVGQAACLDSLGNTSYGHIQPYGTGGSTGTGGTGSYILDTSSSVSSKTLYGVTAPACGQMVAVDHDHIICVAAAQTIVPIYTTNAMSSCTWNLTNLPPAFWMLRGWQFGTTNKPFAVGYGSDLGTVWAALYSGSTVTIYKSTDSGATYSSVGTVATSASNVGIYLLSVPGYPGELWLTGAFTGGTPTKIWHSSDSGTSWTAMTPPIAIPIALTLGAPATPGGYPTLYGIFNTGFGTADYIYQGTYNGSSVTWAPFGPTGTFADLPISCQVAGVSSIRGDWNVYQRLYAASRGCGFAFYNP
jgi:hypothetical protein